MNRLLILTILLSLGSVETSSAQPRNEWINIYGNIGNQEFWIFRDVFAVDDGGFIMCGCSHDDFWVVKTDENGGETWSETYSQNGRRLWSNSVIESDDGDYWVCGQSTFDHESGDIYVLKTDSDGEQIWMREYGGERDEIGTAIIELKEGNFIVSGSTFSFGNDLQGYLAMLDEDGDLLWENNYGEEGNQYLASIRETDGGIIGAGSSIDDFWLLKVDFEGDELWSRTYSRDDTVGFELEERAYAVVSCPDGFALGGQAKNEYVWLLGVDSDGNQLWDSQFTFGEDNRFVGCWGLGKNNDHGFTLAGVSMNGGLVIRTDGQGSEMWHRIYDNPYRLDGIDFTMNAFGQVIISPDGSIVVVGEARYDGFNNLSGVLLKSIPEFTPPDITNYTPLDLDFDILIRDSVRFAVSVYDLQEDSIRYFWTIDGDTLLPDTVANDTSAIMITFDELGEAIIRCNVFDGTESDSVTWIVHVQELYIDTHTPAILDLSIRRNTTVDFSVTTRAIEGDPVQYEWVYDGEILDEFDDSLSIHFEHGRDHEVEVVAYRGDQNDNVIWQITMLDLIVNYWPRELDIAVNIDTLLEFSIEPFGPEDPSLDILWTVDDDSVDNRSWTFIDFDTAGEYQVEVYISDSSSADSMSWNVMVNPNDIGQNELALLPKVPTLYPPSPNPFNSQTSVRYALPVAGQVRLELFDVSGRLVTELVDQRQAAGWYDVVIDGSGLVSGVYFVRMGTQDKVAIGKIILIR